MRAFGVRDQLPESLRARSGHLNRSALPSPTAQDPADPLAAFPYSHFPALFDPLVYSSFTDGLPGTSGCKRVVAVKILCPPGGY